MSVYSKLLSDLPVNSVKGTRKGIYYRGDAIDKVFGNIQKQLILRFIPMEYYCLFLSLHTPMDDSVVMAQIC